MEVANTTRQLVTFQLEDDLFGIDIMFTQEILKLGSLRKIPNSPYYFEGMLNLRGEVIPIISFKKFFTFGTFDLSRDKGIIITRIEGQHFGIVIDKVQRVVAFEDSNIKPTPGGFSKSLKQYIFGVVEYQSEIIAILDVQAIFQITCRDLTEGGEIGHYNLDFRRDKLDYQSSDEEKMIARFLESLDIEPNIVTSMGTHNYFSRMKIKTQSPMSVLVQNAKESMSEDIYSPFKLGKSDQFFDNDSDYFAILALLEQLIIPNKERKETNKIKIVNIGCGRGEELYSILFMLKSYIQGFDKWDITLIGVDENYNQLNFAKEGLYTSSNLTRINKKDLLNHFDEENGSYRVKKSLRNRVVFRFGTAKNVDTINDVDMFFCRGIFSRMENNGIEQLLTTISESLNPQGVLLLNEIEDLYNVGHSLLSAKEINGHRYYIRI